MGGRKQKFVDNSLSIAHRLIIISSSQSVLNKTLWLVSLLFASVTHQELRACLHGVGDPGLVGLVSFVFTL